MFNRELNYTKSFDKIIHFNMKRIFFAITSAIRLKRNMFILLIILSLISIILGVISAINFDGGVLPIDLTNIVFIRYLKDDCGVFYLFFGSILNLAVFYFMILLCCAKRWLTPLACIIYMYFIFAQTVVLVSIILIYGFFSTLILLMLLLIYLLLEILLLMLLIIAICPLSDCSCYFQQCFSNSNNVVPFITMALIVLAILFCIMLIILRSFVLLLIF